MYIIKNPSSHPKWKERRKFILDRDKCCRECGDIYNLHVHHKCYSKNFLYWEYPDHLLVTLCKSCHKKVHDRIPIGEFYVKLKDYDKDPRFATRKKITGLVKRARYSKPEFILYLYVQKYKTFKRIDCEELSYYCNLTNVEIYHFLINKGLKYRKTKQ